MVDLQAGNARTGRPLKSLGVELVCLDWVASGQAQEPHFSLDERCRLRVASETYLQPSFKENTGSRCDLTLPSTAGRSGDPCPLSSSLRGPSSEGYQLTGMEIKKYDFTRLRQFLLRVEAKLEF